MTTKSNKFHPGTHSGEIRQEILKLCRAKFLSKQELASRLGLSINTLRAYYLYPMIKLGDIELLIPEHPRSQKQAYRSKR